jgi:hypothetical protein
MQTDLTELEFEAFVKALARRFEGEPFDELAFPPDRWRDEERDRAAAMREREER